MVSYTDISYSIGGKTILKNISCTIIQNSTVAIIGPSGVGKTTLLKLLGGILEPSNGHIEYEGNIITSTNRKHFFQTHISVVFQEYGLFPWMNVWDNIHIATIAHPYRDKAVTQKIIERIGLQGTEQKYPHELSGGMRQRVAVGRAIANNSRILLLDEPFSALDYMTKQTMQKFIQDIQQEFKKTVIFVTHNFDDAYMTSDQVIVLDPINHQVIYIDNPKKARYIGDTPYIGLKQKLYFTQ